MQNETSTEVTEERPGNELHAAAGDTCPRCGREIRPNQAVRRTISGAYQHDCC